MSFPDRRPSGIIAMLVIAAAVRVPVALVQSAHFPPGWGGEMSAVATSLASHHGFGSPYWVPTGPTALVPPVYPLLLAGVFVLFGIHVPLSGLVALGLGALVSAAICIPVTRLARRVFEDAAAGLVAGWTWALFPITGWTDALFLWNTGLFALLLAWFALQTVEAGPDITWPKLVAFGLLGGLLVMVETTAFPVVGLSAVALMVWRRLTVRRLVLFLGVAATLPALWLYRNQAVFHEPVFLRSGLGLQLAEGMREPAAVSVAAPVSLPNRNAAELRRYAELGEPAYMRARLQEGMRAIRANPGTYGKRVIARAFAFWFGSPAAATLFWFYGQFALPKMLLYMAPTVAALAGLVLLFRRRHFARWYFAALLAGLPVPYLLTHVEFRYRLPLEPLMFVLAAGPIAMAARLRKKGQAGTP